MKIPLKQRYRNFIRRLVEKDPIKYQELRANLLSARFGVTLEHYLELSYLFATAIGIIFSAIFFALSSLILTFRFTVNIYNIVPGEIPQFITPGTLIIFRAVFAIIVFFVFFMIGYKLAMKFPDMERKNREIKINLTIHNAVSYIYAMQRGGATMMQTFRSIAESAGVYGEVAYEFRMIVRDADYFGKDFLTAARDLTVTTPSDRLKDFLDDIVSVSESGGDMVNFLQSKVKLYQEEAKFEQTQFLNTMQLVAESYVTVFVAGPLFLIIIMIVMGFMGGMAEMQFTMVTYAAIPIGSLIFILFLDMISLSSEKMEKFSVIKVLQEYADVKVYHKSGEEEQFKRMQKYDRFRTLKQFIRHPINGILANINILFYVTLPLAFIYIFLIYFLVPPYQDLNLYITVVDEHIFFAVLFILVPYAVFYEMWRWRIQKIESSIPDFLDRLSNINQVGLTLAQAIGVLVKANLGLLSYEIHRIKRDLDWGATLNNALVRFENRVRTPMISRMVTLITKASEMSGDVGEILGIAAMDAKMSETLKKVRMSEMLIYVIIIYIAFFVFLFVIIVMDVMFIEHLAEINIDQTSSGIGGGTAMLGSQQMPVLVVERLLYHTCIFQALFSGLIAGMMGEGSIRAGVKHSIVMIVIAISLFIFFI